jgi:hypothetical protein
VSIDFVLSCDGCAHDYARVWNRTAVELRTLAFHNGWVQRTVNGWDMDLCGGCKSRPDTELLATIDGPF